MPSLTAARYGKDNIRVCKVDKDSANGTQTVTEMTVCVLLEGEIQTSYTKADNSVVVPTDTMKQTTYIFAKQHPVNPPELFASILAAHFLETYPWLSRSNIKVIQHRWTRMSFNGKPHPHSFFRDGTETRNVEAVASRSSSDSHSKMSLAVRSAIAGLLVLKSTGSAFHGFNQDEFTILTPTNDRILSTEVDCGWHWQAFDSVAAVEKAAGVGVHKEEGKEGTFDRAWKEAREITLETFANDSSPSVQNTMYKMSEQILAKEEGVASVDYELPNKHYFEIDLGWHKGLKNTGKDAEVYAPQSNPNGLIQCSVSR